MRVQILKKFLFSLLIICSDSIMAKFIDTLKKLQKFQKCQKVQTGHFKKYVEQNICVNLLKNQQQPQSVSFCMQRKMESIRKYINLAIVLDLQNYQLSMKKWFQFRKLFHQIDEPMMKSAFEEFLPIVKPVIYNFSQVTSKFSPDKYGFYTSLSAKQVLKIKQVFEPLRKYEFVQDSSSISNKIEDEQIQKRLQKPQNPIYILNLNEIPSNKEVQWWSHSIAARNTIVISKVVKGKGIATKQLGMPTANLEMTKQIQKQLLQYPNGIYISKFKFQDKQFDGKSQFTAVASIGTNPEYQNFTNCRCVEAYVINDFKEEKFYDQKVSLELLRLIRLQGKFPSFDSFLNAMHNDIQMGKLYGI